MVNIGENFFINIINMRKVILSLAVSLDNFIEGPNGEYDWCFQGTPLFHGIKSRIHLNLTDSKIYSSGLVSLSYQIH
jgi:hypothetical protein